MEWIKIISLKSLIYMTHSSSHFIARTTDILLWFVVFVNRTCILLEPLISTPSFSGVSVTRPLVVCVCFVDRCLSFCTFYFGHCVVCYSSIYGFWLSVWYLQILLAVGRINRIYFILVHKYTYLSYLILICWKNYQKG